MRKTTYPLRRNIAVIAAAAVVGSVGIGGLVTANADSGPTGNPGQSQVAPSDGETNDDATDTGPDANPNEPGHQDASDSDGDGEQNDATEAEQSDGDGEMNDAAEAAQGNQSDGETNDDATDTGPDANPNEPGHQDASDVR